MSRQITLLRICGVAIGAGLIAFFAFYEIFGIWTLALVVGLATGVFLAIVGGLFLANVTYRESYRHELERLQRAQEQRAQREWKPFRRTRMQERPQEPDEPGVVESELVKIIPAENEEPEIVPQPPKSETKGKAKKQPVSKPSVKQKESTSPRPLFFGRREIGKKRQKEEQKQSR